MLLLYFVAAGVLIGVLLGGRLERLSTVTFRWAPVALAGLAFQLLLFSGPANSVVGAWGPALYVASTGAVLVALLRNLGQPAFKLIAAGAALNLLAIAANGGQMPYSPEAMAAVTGVTPLAAPGFTNSIVAGAGSWFAALGDDFALPRPIPFANVFSIGDVLIGVGAALFLVRAMRPAGRIAAGTARSDVRSTSGSTGDGADAARSTARRPAARSTAGHAAARSTAGRPAARSTGERVAAEGIGARSSGASGGRSLGMATGATLLMTAQVVEVGGGWRTVSSGPLFAPDGIFDA